MRFRAATPTAFLTAAVLLAAPPAPAATPFDDLLAAVPANANCLAFFDVKAAYDSPISVKENWRGEFQEKFKAKVNNLPPDAQRVVVAMDVNMNSLGRTSQLALVRVRSAPGMQQIGAREGGTIDLVADRSVLLSPRDVYFTTLDGSTVAAQYPADRQALARWLRQVRGGSRTELSPYLAASAAVATSTPFGVALDLSDAFDPRAVRAIVERSPAVAGKNVNKDGLARFVAGTRGIAFNVEMGSTMVGHLRVDLLGDPGPFRSVLKDLLLESIENQGASIPGLENWDVKFGDKSMTLTGPMTHPDFERVLSLFDFPNHEAENGTEGPSVAQTKRYLDAVAGYVAEVQKPKQTRNAKEYEKTALWTQQYAEKIEQLSRRGVDPIALEAGKHVADRLRGIAGSLRGVPITVKQAENSAYTIVAMSRGWYGGGVAMNSNAVKVQEMAAKAIADDERNRDRAWSEIEKAVIDARLALGDKYKTPF